VAEAAGNPFRAIHYLGDRNSTLTNSILRNGVASAGLSSPWLRLTAAFMLRV
jgi:hypothetical protein